MTSRAWLVAALALAVLGVACDSDVCRHTGQRGEFVFEYYSEKDTHNFNKPVIVDGCLALYVYRVGTENAVDITEATSRQAGVVRVEGHATNRLTIQGVAPGRARIDVRATVDGQPRTDTIAIRVDRGARIQFDAAGSWVVGERDFRVEGDSDYLRFPAGARVEIPWTRWSATGEPLVGYGVFPIEMQPAESADVDEYSTDDDALTLFMPDMPMVFEVYPADGYRGDRLTIEVYEPSVAEQLVTGLHRGAHDDGHTWCDTPLEWARRHLFWFAPLWMIVVPLICFPVMLVARRA